MSKNAKTTNFLKECLSDSLLKLMREKSFGKITIDEIAEGAGVNRSTWFRNYSAKTEALTFKLVQLWGRFAQDRALLQRQTYTLENAMDFFQFNYDNRELLAVIWDAEQHAAIYEAFYQIMMPRFGAEEQERYFTRFFSYGMFGMLGEWRKRDFQDTPEEMSQIFHNMIGVL